MPTKPDREVERMAKLLWDAGEQWAFDQWAHPKLPWDEISHFTQDRFRALARAVLADSAKPKRRTTRART